MDQTRARELQEKLALEAAAMLSLAGSGAETAPYEQAVSLIGKAWRLTAEETSEQLALIEQEKAVMGRIENGESAEHIRQELLLNWSGLESIEVLEGLFETSTLLETAPERRSLFDMAMLLIETQNLLDWIEKTDAEKEELIQNFTEVSAGEESRAKARLSSMWGDSPPLAAVLPCVPFSGAGWHPYTTALFGRFVEALCRPFPKWAVIVLH